MYTPKCHALTNVEAMQSHIAQHPLGSWVCTVDSQLITNHIPFVLDAQHGRHGRLRGDVSRANPVWRDLTQGALSVVMFMGPHAYITPSWYPGKQAHRKVVPTWNYVTVHVRGVARAIEDPAWVLGALNRLTDEQESQRPDCWKVSVS